MRIGTKITLLISLLPCLTANIATAGPLSVSDVSALSGITSVEQIAHRRASSRGMNKAGAANAAPAASAYDSYTGFGSGGRMNADDDFAFGGYDPDFVVDYGNGWNTPGFYGDPYGFGAGYGAGMWGW